MAAPPSTLLAESLASFSRAAHQAFAAIENEARIKVAQATSETREARHERDEARRERDEAVQARHACQLEMQLLRQEAGEYKASLKQVDTAIAHKEDIILQLRREGTQWKDQSRNWQEHFLRVEQERCRLSSRIDELVAERLLCHGHTTSAPFTPRSNYADLLESAPSSSSTKRASSSNQPPAYKSAMQESPPGRHSPSDGVHTHKVASRRKSSPVRETRRQRPPTADLTLTTLTKQRPSVHHPQTQSHIACSSAHSQPPISTTRMSHPEVRSEPRQVFIRRVQAVVELPVKEEDMDEDSFDHSELSASTSASASLSGSGSADVATKSRKIYGNNVVQSNDENLCMEEDEDEMEPSDAAPSSERSDEEDDELMMGTEDNRKELYGTKPILSENQCLQNRNITTKSADPPSSKKRKLAVTRKVKPPKKSR